MEKDKLNKKDLPTKEMGEQSSLHQQPQQGQAAVRKAERQKLIEKIVEEDAVLLKLLGR